MDATAVPKAQLVFETTYQPTAKCAGVADGTPCPQRWNDEDAAATAAAKRHAELHPGHRVRVSTEKRAIYVAQ